MGIAQRREGIYRNSTAVLCEEVIDICVGMGRIVVKGNKEEGG